MCGIGSIDTNSHYPDECDPEKHGRRDFALKEPDITYSTNSSTYSEFECPLVLRLYALIALATSHSPLHKRTESVVDLRDKMRELRAKSACR